MKKLTLTHCPVYKEGHTWSKSRLDVEPYYYYVCIHCYTIKISKAVSIIQAE